mmetsp:Transcript_12357/g.40642  ORF Transcript_12357/g.40642 Transcript_12357/m.40642 type:complete len:575 (-) Transcript_12357:665-2389(-)
MDGEEGRLREMLKAQHSLIESLKARTGGGSLVWKMVAGIAVTLLCFMAFVQAAEAGTQRPHVGPAALSHPIEASAGVGNPALHVPWTSERMLGYFGVPTASQVRWATGVNTLTKLYRVLASDEIHMVQADVSYREVEGEDGPVMQPVLDTVSPSESHVTFDHFLEVFIRSDTQKGLSLHFRDPRVVVSCLKVMKLEMEFARLMGPIVVGGEMLTGPFGALPYLGTVPLTEREIMRVQTEGLYKLSALAKELDSRPPAVPFDGVAFIQSIKEYMPTALLSIGWGSKGTCADPAFKPWEERGTTRDAVRLPQGREGGRKADNSLRYKLGFGPSDRDYANFINKMRKDGKNPQELESALYSGRRRALLAEMNRTAATPAFATVGGGRFSGAAESAEEEGRGETRATAAALGRRSAGARRRRLLAQYNEPGVWPSTSYAQYHLADVYSGTAPVNNILATEKGYTAKVVFDMMSFMVNATWPGDVMFEMDVCFIESTDASYHQLINMKLGYTGVLKGRLGVDAATDAGAQQFVVANFDPATTFWKVTDKEGHPLTTSWGLSRKLPAMEATAANTGVITR